MEVVKPKLRLGGRAEILCVKFDLDISSLLVHPPYHSFGNFSIESTDSLDQPATTIFLLNPPGRTSLHKAFIP